jgi:DtxR family Mn-dependent transcriptional regulator
MVDPALALLTSVAVAALLGVLFWPARGLFWYSLRAMRSSERERIEDALKHLYDCEYHGHPCTRQSLSGALSLRGSRAAELLGRLRQLELVVPVEAGYRLTPEGRRDALRVIRIHRLWERYLSDETGVPPLEWHGRAEIEEHRTSPEEADRLAARMGHPRFDPHGDPIPTAGGEIGPRRGRPLTEFAEGKHALVVHVEDEPDAVYAQLLAAGLHAGMWIRVLESSPRLVRLEIDAEERVLAPALAANVWVEALPDERRLEGPLERLSALDVGERAKVVGISTRCRGPERRRMLDLGLVPGTLVQAEMRSPGGDPTAYRIRGGVIALRREQADLIQVDRDGGGVAP